MRPSSEALRVGLFRDHVGEFLRRLESESYAAKTIRQKLHTLAEMSRWSLRHRASAFDEELLRQFIHDPRRHYRTTRGIATTGRQIIECLRASGDLPSSEAVVQPDGATLIEAAYTAHLREERAVADTTAAVYLRLVHPFVLEHLSDGWKGFAKLNAQGVIRFVVRQARKMTPCYAKLHVTALRSFLRFAYVHDSTKLDLAAAVPTIPYWRLATLPRFIPAEDVRRLVRSCDRRTHGGCRDHAILLLLARLGLRASEVAHLELDDIDWDAAELSVHGKGHRLDRIPLPNDVGRALATYIRRVRPRCASRVVFMRLQAPVRGLGGTAIAHIVRRAIERVGLRTPSHGAHLLRHSLATTLLRHGSSLPEIAELLRHRSPETTMLYAKVDLGALHRVSPPWPE